MKFYNLNKEILKNWINLEKKIEDGKITFRKPEKRALKIENEKNQNKKIKEEDLEEKKKNTDLTKKIVNSKLLSFGDEDE